MNVEEACTYRRFLGRGRYGAVCGRPEADEAVHSWPNERKRIGTHIWRHEPKTAAAHISPVMARRKPGPERQRTRDYELGYNSGYQAAARAALREEPALDVERLRRAMQAAGSLGERGFATTVAAHYARLGWEESGASRPVEDQEKP